MSRKQTTDMKRWELIADQTRRVQAELSALHTLLSTVPKTVHRSGFGKTDDGLTKLKSDLEDRMAAEHPDTWDTHTFYGETEHYDQAKDRVREAANALITDERRAVIETVDDIGPATETDIERVASDHPDGEELNVSKVRQILLRGEERGTFQKTTSEEEYRPVFERVDGTTW